MKDAKISIHKELLNNLYEMQASPAYATRRPVLVAAEYIIFGQEQEIKSLRAKVAELERTDMDKMRAQAIADADDLTALAERSAEDERSAFENWLTATFPDCMVDRREDGTYRFPFAQLHWATWQARAQQAPAEAVQQVGDFESCWAICEETGYANDQELARIAFKAGQAAAIPEGMVPVPIGPPRYLVDAMVNSDVTAEGPLVSVRQAANLYRAMIAAAKERV